MLMPRIYHENLFDDLFDSFPFIDNDLNKAEKKLYGHNASHVMSTDIKEKDDSYELEMDLPGFKKEDIRIQLENGYLVISASKGLDQSSEDKKDSYIHRERYSGSCSRSFYVGSELTEEEIKAEFHHGILKLLIPKKEAKAALPEKKYIAIEG